MSNIESSVVKAKYLLVTEEIRAQQAVINEKMIHLKILEELLREIESFAFKIQAPVSTETQTSQADVSETKNRARSLRLSPDKRRMYSMLIQEGELAGADIAKKLSLKRKYVHSAFRVSIDEGDVVTNNGKYSITETGKAYLYKVLEQFPLSEERVESSQSMEINMFELSNEKMAA